MSALVKKLCSVFCMCQHTHLCFLLRLSHVSFISLSSSTLTKHSSKDRKSSIIYLFYFAGVSVYLEKHLRVCKYVNTRIKCKLANKVKEIENMEEFLQRYLYGDSFVRYILMIF